MSTKNQTQSKPDANKPAGEQPSQTATASVSDQDQQIRSMQEENARLEQIRSLQEENLRLRSMVDAKPAPAPRPFIRVAAGQLDSSEVDIKNGGVIPASEATSPGGTVLDLTPIYAKDALELEAFMRDEVEITLMEPGNENDPAFVEVTVNGDYRCLVRDGSVHKVRRYHLQVLAQAKQSRVRQEKVVNGDGSMAFVEKQVLSLTYPFSMVADPNPRKGGPWLRELLKVPA